MSLFQRIAGMAPAMAMATGFAGWSAPAAAAGQQDVAAPAAAVAMMGGSIAAPLTTFASLDAAIAAQADAGSDEATRCLASAIYFESKGEPVEGQLAVAEVVINRARSGRFPADVCGVVTQRGQFGFVRAGVIPTVDADRSDYRTAVSVAKVALGKAWRSSAPDALYFHGRRERTPARVVRVAAIGNHVFYR